MKYMIVGARRDTGEDVQLLVDAADAREARDKAVQSGLLVERCTEAGDKGGLKGGELASEAATDPRYLRPGEHDCFFDSLMLGLLRRQVEPDELLIACDVQQPRGGQQRTMLLTPRRLLWVGISNQHGQHRIVDRREIDLKEIDDVSVTTSPAKAFGQPSHLIQVATRDGIERWTSAYSSGRRLVEATLALRRGEQVRPFIRRTEDMAGMTTAAASPPAMSGIIASMPPWTDRLVLPWLRTTTNPRFHQIVLAVGTLASALAVLLLFAGVVVLLEGNFNAGPLLIWTFVSIVTVLIAIPNVCFAKARLGTGRSGESAAPARRPTVRVRPAVSHSPAWRSLPWGRTVSVLLPVALFGGLTWWAYSYYQSQMFPSLPRINVLGEKSVTVTNWRIDAGRWLFGTARYSGDAFVELHYKVTENGVVRDTGVVNSPKGGTTIRGDEPLEVRIMLPDRPTSNTLVEITAIGA